MKVAYIIIKILIVQMYITTFFALDEGWLHILNTLFWTPAVFAIFFLKGDTQVMTLLVTVGISFFLTPVVLYDLYGPAGFFQPLIMIPLVFYIIYLYKDDL
ncbi:hypothetical protein [Oceanobacillus sp. CAU 1775]